MVRTVRCPNCNATLALDPAQPTLHCDYCKTDLLNPAQAPEQAAPVAGGGAARGRTGIIVVVAGLAVLLGGGLVVYLLGARGSQPRGASVAAQTPLRSTVQPVARQPSGPQLAQVLGATEQTGDGVAELVFGTRCDAQSGGLYRCGVGLLDGQNGSLRWSKTYLTTTSARGARMLCHGVVVVQDNTRSIVGYEAGSGAERWRLTLSDFIRYQGRPAGSAARPVCLFATEDRALSVVDVKTGKLLWRRDGLSPWGMRDVQPGADSLLLGGLVLDLESGVPRKTGLASSQRQPPIRRAAFVLAGAHAYRRAPRAHRIEVYRSRDWHRQGQVDPGPGGSLGLYPVGSQVLLLDAFRPPTRLALLDGARLSGPLVVSPDEAIAQARLAGETILLLTISTRGTRQTTLRAYDRALKGERWRAQLDATGKSFGFKTIGPNFGGHGGRTAGGDALLGASASLLFVELSPEQGRARLSVRALDDGKVLGEISWPRAGHGGLRGIHTGPGRVFVRDAADAIVALDPATRRVLWTYPPR